MPRRKQAPELTFQQHIADFIEEFLLLASRQAYNNSSGCLQNSGRMRAFVHASIVQVMLLSLYFATFVVLHLSHYQSKMAS